MRYHGWLTSVLLLASSAFSQQNQYGDVDRVSGIDDYSQGQLFIMRAYLFPAATPGQVDVDIRVSMAYDILQFVRESPDSFRAAYEITMAILDKKRNQAAGKVLRDAIVVHSFSETNSRRQTRNETFQVSVAPGEYTLSFDVMDLDTQKHLRREEPLHAADFGAGQLQLSSLVFVDYSRALAWRDSLEFNLASTFRPRRELHGLYFELSGVNGQPVDLHYLLRNHRDEKVGEWDEQLPAGTTRHLIDLEKWLRNPGQYSLEVQARDTRTTRMRRESFSVMSSVVEADSTAVKAASGLIEPLRYIAKGSEIKKITVAPEAARDSLIADFWKQRDPTPGTTENELLAEYNRRLDFAITNFSLSRLGRSGWQTDRGRIYIQYGPPSDIQHQQPQGRSPARFEMWYYKNLDRSYVFREELGTGDYVLVAQR